MDKAAEYRQKDGDNLKERFHYEQDIEQNKKITEFLLMDFYKGISLNTDFIDFHNEHCPSCKKEFPKYVQYLGDVGTVSGFYSMESRAIFIYALCKTCSNELVLLSHRSLAERSEKAQLIETYVVNKMNALQLA